MAGSLRVRWRVVKETRSSVLFARVAAVRMKDVREVVFVIRDGEREVNEERSSILNRACGNLDEKGYKMFR